MTYAESKNEIPIDWRQIIDNALEGDEPSHTLRMYSAFWISCPCGNQDVRIERVAGKPKDRDLYELGNRFPSAVINSQWSEALLLLDAIEARAAVLLGQAEEMGSSNLILSQKAVEELENITKEELDEVFADREPISYFPEPILEDKVC